MLNIFCFVEDPGATNFLIGLEQKKINFHIYAYNHAKAYLESYGIKYKTNLDKVNYDYFDFFLIGTSENKKVMWPDVISKIKKKKIALLIDTPTFVNERISFIEKSLLKKINFVFLSDNVSKSGLSTLGINKERVFKVSPQKFVYLSKIKKEKHSRNIIFFTELSQGINETKFLKDSEYRFNGFSDQTERTKIVLEEFILASKCIKDKFKLALRIHPKENIRSYKRYLNFFDSYSDTGNSVQILKDCYLAVGLTSNILAEAAAMGIKVLSITPKKNEISWINSQYRKRIIHIYSKKKLYEFFKNFPQEEFFFHKKDNHNYFLLEEIIMKLVEEKL